MAEGEKWSGQPLGTTVGIGDTLSMLQGGDNVRLPYEVLINKISNLPDPPHDISTANTLITVPTITGLPQKYTYYWTGGDGSNTFKFVTGTTIGGIDSALWVGEGEGRITIESDGTNWQVRDYEDSGGSGTDKWQKYIDGTIKQTRSLTAITGVTFIASGNIFILNGNKSWTFLKEFHSLDYAKVSAGFNSSSPRWSYMLSPTTVSAVFRILASTSTTSYDYSGIAIGRWRT